MFEEDNCIGASEIETQSANMSGKKQQVYCGITIEFGHQAMPLRGGYLVR